MSFDVGLLFCASGLFFCGAGLFSIAQAIRETKDTSVSGNSAILSKGLSF